MANFNLNKIMLGGRLTSDPELKQTQNGTQVASFGVAVNRRQRSEGNQQTADFFNVTAWRGLAEHVARYYKKGSSIFIIGSIQNRSWTDSQGVKRYATDIIADEIHFVDSKAEAPQGSAYVPEAYADTGLPRFENTDQNEDLPF